MKKIVLILSFFLLANACKKEIITKRNYIQPSASENFYGLWKNTSNQIYKIEYIRFKNDGTYLADYLLEDQYGLRISFSFIYTVTKNQIRMNFGRNEGYANYKIKNDTLIIDNGTEKDIYVKDNSSNYNIENWTKKTSIIYKIDNINHQLGDQKGTIGFNDQSLFFSSYNKLFKYNLATNKLIDSSNIGFDCGVTLKGNNLYLGSEEDYILKSNLNLDDPTTLSTNILIGAISLSTNPNSNAIYAYSYNYSILYKGEENQNFNEEFDLNDYSANSMVYYKDDEYLMILYNNLYKVKLKPNFQITENYKILENYQYESVSTNGKDVWLKAYNEIINKYELLKLDIN